MHNSLCHFFVGFIYQTLVLNNNMSKKKTINTKAWLWSIAFVVILSLFFFIFFQKDRNGNSDTETIWYDGPNPPVVTVSLERNGVEYGVDAFEGQAIVYFLENVSHKKAVGILKKHKATILSQVPGMHFYHIQVKAGTESAFVKQMKDLSEVDYVYPVTVLYPNNAIPYVIDNFKSDHGRMVTEMMKFCSPELTVKTFDVGVKEDYVNLWAFGEYLDRIFNYQAYVNNTGFVTNMSYGISLCSKKCRLLYDDDVVTDSMRNAYFNNYIDLIVGRVKDLKHRILYEKYIHRNSDPDFVITMAAGNEGMKEMEKIYSAIKEEMSDSEYDIFCKHLILVTAKDDNKEGDYPNDVSNGNYHFMQTKVDISDMTAQNLHWQGTSFAAPRAAGIIIAVANEYNKKVCEVLRYAREVTRQHPQHLLTYEDLSARVADLGGYIDLGLPSGTLWKCENEAGLYENVDAVAKFGDNLPTKDQYEELANNCNSYRIRNTLRFISRINGKAIDLPIVGMYDCEGTFCDAEQCGGYWTSSGDDDFWRYCALVQNKELQIGEEGSCCRYSVRLARKGVVESQSHNRTSNKNKASFNNKNFPFDYYGTMPYSREMYNSKSSGNITLSNGDILHYKFVVESALVMEWYVEFSMDGCDISKKYDLALLESLDASEGYVGDVDLFVDGLKVTMCMIDYVDVGANSLYVIVREKKQR